MLDRAIHLAEAKPAQCSVSVNQHDLTALLAKVSALKPFHSLSHDMISSLLSKARHPSKITSDTLCIHCRLQPAILTSHMIAPLSNSLMPVSAGLS